MANLSGEMSNQKGINFWQVLNYLFNKKNKKLASILEFKRREKKEKRQNDSCLMRAVHLCLRVSFSGLISLTS